MPIVPWQCALGDAPPVTRPVAATVEIAPPDDSVDTNKIVITGTGSISSFGADAPKATKDITFDPLGGSITLINSAQLVVLGAISRTIDSKSFGRYSSDGAGNWEEISFFSSATVTAPIYYSAALNLIAGTPNISAANAVATIRSPSPDMVC